MYRVIYDCIDEITAALKGLDLETLSLEEIVRQALKNMIH